MLRADLLSGTSCWIIVYKQISERYKPKESSYNKDIYMLVYIFAAFITFWEERQQQQCLFKAITESLIAKNLHGSVYVARITCFVFFFRPRRFKGGIMFCSYIIIYMVLMIQYLVLNFHTCTSRMVNVTQFKLIRA